MPTNLNNTNINLSTSGFTFLELLVVTAMMGILSAIAAPSWLSFTNVTRLKTAQDEIYFAMRQAQSQAKLQKLTWQTSFREQNGIVQWAVHPASISSDNATWNSLDASVRIDTETTLQQSGDVRRVQFNHIQQI
jgi:prepilin-type N-terminal cleavage/methylation domain-containing protein